PGVRCLLRAVHRASVAFATRRASDLQWPGGEGRGTFGRGRDIDDHWSKLVVILVGTLVHVLVGVHLCPQRMCAAGKVPVHMEGRSEEHTSELQSREKLVCRVLLEKKK